MLKQVSVNPKSFFSAIKNFFSKRHKHTDWDESSENIRSGFGRMGKFFQEKLSGTRERLILVCSLAALLIIILISIVMINNSRNSIRAESPALESNHNIIPPEELFLPEEPDFIPGILLDRGQRTSWTEDDAKIYWQDPLVYGEEPWRDQIEKSVNEIMEGIP